MVKMGNVWDRTGEVLDGRGGMLAGFAVVALFLPAVVQLAYISYAAPGTGAAIINGLMTIAVMLAAIWGQLAIIAAASDPVTDRAAAIAQASRRWAPALAVAAVLSVILCVALLPMLGLLSAAGVDFTRLGNGAAPDLTSPGLAGLAMLYGIALFVVILFAGVRMLPVYAVVLHERLGLGAMARSWRLTRRHTWRLIGVLLLFLIVFVVATSAARSVSGLILRLALGGDAKVTVDFLSAVVAQAASTALTVVAITFSAQLYVALRARDQALRDKAARREVPS